MKPRREVNTRTDSEVELPRPECSEIDSENISNQPQNKITLLQHNVANLSPLNNILAVNILFWP